MRATFSIGTSPATALRRAKSMCLLILALAVISFPPALPEAARDSEALRALIQEESYSLALKMLSPGDVSRGDRSVLFQKAYCLHQLGRWDEAVVLYQSLLGQSSSLDDYLRLFLATCLARSGRPDDAIAQLKVLLAEEESLLQSEARELMGEVYLEWGRPEEAAPVFQALAEDSQLKAHRSRLNYRLAQAYHQAGRSDESASILSSIIVDTPFRQEAFLALQELPTRRQMPLTGNELHQAGWVCFHQGQYDEAIAHWDRFLAGDPHHRLAPEVLLLTAKASYRSRKYPQARDRCQRLLNLYPQSEQVTSAHYLLARCSEGDGRIETAIQEYEQFVRAYPWSQLADEVLWQVAAIYERQGDLMAAEGEYVTLARSYANRKHADMALWRAALYAYLRGDDDTTLSRLEELMSTSSGGILAQGALYWSARVHQRAGRPAQAAELLDSLIQGDEGDYYVERARELLGPQVPETVPPAAHLEEIIWNHWTPADAEPQGDELQRRVEKGKALLQLGLLRRARNELWAAHGSAHRHPQLLLDLLQLYREHQLYGDALRLAETVKSHLQEPIIDQALIPYLFPQSYLEAVRAEAQAYGMDPYLILALMRVESLFDPLAVSPAGAHGLLQVMPATEREIARELGVSEEAIPSPFRPQWSIRAGVYYLWRQHERFGWHSELALAAYNAGPGNVIRWERRLQGADPLLFAELIDFRETRLFIKKVLASRARYRRLWGDGS